MNYPIKLERTKTAICFIRRVPDGEKGWTGAMWISWWKPQWHIQFNTWVNTHFGKAYRFNLCISFFVFDFNFWVSTR